MYRTIDPAKGSFHQQFSEGSRILFSENGRQDIYDMQFNKLASKNVTSNEEHFSATELTSITAYLEDHKTADMAQKRADICQLLGTPKTNERNEKAAEKKRPPSEAELNAYRVGDGAEEFSG